jgi:hypothetical protein
LRSLPSLAILLAALPLGCASADTEKNQPATETTPSPAETRQEQVAHEWLVKLRPGVDPGRLAALYKPVGLVEFRQIAPDLYLLRFSPEAQMTETRVREIGSDTLLYVQPNFIYHTF